ncbi:MAG TPA: EcsC family protein [Micromonospora sp.]|nr:EcsC family protein [Micromonospora sp.]
MTKAAPALLFQPPTVEEKTVPRQPDIPAAPEAPVTGDILAVTGQPLAKGPATAVAAEAAAEPGKAAENGNSAKKATTEPVRRPADPEAPPMIAVRLLDHPGYAPELLALAAVQTFGPGAQDWAQKMKAAYPAATRDGLARLAAHRFSRFAVASGAASATAGLLVPLAGLTTLTWAQIGLVLHLAAAYGQDPTDPERAVDLLVLLRVHPDDKAARAALATARQISADADEVLYRLAEAGGRIATPATRRYGRWVARRLAARLLPGVALVSGAVGGSSTVQRLAARAVARYRAGAAD